MSVRGCMLAAMEHVELPQTGRLANMLTTAEALSAGVSPARLRTLVKRGQLWQVGRGVYVSAALAERLQMSAESRLALRAASVVAPLGREAVISHHTAAQIHGLDLLDYPPDEIAITRIPGKGSRKSWQGVRAHVAALPARHVGSRLGIPLTTGARTVVDLARTSSFPAGLVVADSALRQKLASKEQLRAVIADCPRWPGLRQAADVVAFANSLAESALESIARAAFRGQGLPPPELQVYVGGENGIVGRVDFLWRQYGTIAEVDGAKKYDTRSEAMYQLRRDARLREAGFEVVHFSWREITEMPAEVAASIRAAFQRGGQRRSPGSVA
jgi:hypothetical protein